MSIISKPVDPHFPIGPRGLSDEQQNWYEKMNRGFTPDAVPVPDTKLSNPKDIVGVRKAPLSVLPWRVLWGVGLAMLEGACKYGRHNYRAVGVRASVYFDAVVSRHMGAWWEGEDIDAESGLSHIDKAIAGLMVMRDSMLAGNFVDDRPPRSVSGMDDLNRLAGEIMDRHKDKSPKHYTIGDTL